MGDRDRDLPVFVYGTLRRGGRNEVVAGDRVRRRVAAILHGAVLHAGPRYPWIRDGAGTVVGELLVPIPSLRAGLLDDLDRLERHIPGGGDNEYERVVREVVLDDGSGTRARAWTYVAGPSAALGPVVTSGDWFDHPSATRPGEPTPLRKASTPPVGRRR